MTDVVYFAHRDGLVKIGTTGGLAGRISQLNRGSCAVPGVASGAVELLATLPGQATDRTAPPAVPAVGRVRRAGEPDRDLPPMPLRHPREGRMSDLDIKPDMGVDEAKEFVAYVHGVQDEAPRRVAEAYRRRAWLALGYESWAAMCDGEDLRLPREVTAELRAGGLSIRAIAAVQGMDPKTVRNDLSGGDFPRKIPHLRQSSGSTARAIRRRAPSQSPRKPGPPRKRPLAISCTGRKRSLPGRTDSRPPHCRRRGVSRSC